MTEPMTPERLSEIEQRRASGRIINVVERDLIAEVRRLQAAVERVRELHVPDGEGFCRACDYGTQHPCPTITALDGPAS